MLKLHYYKSYREGKSELKMQETILNYPLLKMSLFKYFIK